MFACRIEWSTKGGFTLSKLIFCGERELSPCNSEDVMIGSLVASWWGILNEVLGFSWDDESMRWIEERESSEISFGFAKWMIRESSCSNVISLISFLHSVLSRYSWLDLWGRILLSISFSKLSINISSYSFLRLCILVDW